MLKHLLIRVQTGKRVKMDEQLFTCPRCERGKEPKLYVNSEKGLFNCFRCGFAGPISRLRNYPEIYSQVEDRDSLSTFSRLHEAKVKAHQLNAELLRPLKPFRDILEEDAEFDYLLSRGWDGDIISCYNVLVSDNDKYINRVFITVEDDKNDTVFFTGRSIDKDTMPKYMNSVAKKDFVFKAKTPVDEFYTDNAYICEGIFDAFKLPGGIALLGKTLTKAQHTSLFSALRSKKNIYICLDPGTQRETKAIAKELDSWFPNKNIYTIDWGTETNIDLGDLSSKMSRTDLMSFVYAH